MRFTVALLLALCCRTAFGCSCASGTLPWDFERVQLVFMANVTALEPNGDSPDVMLQVSKVWKSDGQPIMPISGNGFGMCSFQFQPGRSYIIFAYRSTPAEGQEAGKLLVDTCSHTLDLVYSGKCAEAVIDCQRYNQQVVEVLDFLYGQAARQGDSR